MLDEPKKNKMRLKKELRTKLSVLLSSGNERDVEKAAVFHDLLEQVQQEMRAGLDERMERKERSFTIGWNRRHSRRTETAH